MSGVGDGQGAVVTRAVRGVVPRRGGQRTVREAVVVHHRGAEVFNRRDEEQRAVHQRQDGGQDLRQAGKVREILEAEVGTRVVPRLGALQQRAQVPHALPAVATTDDGLDLRRAPLQQSRVPDVRRPLPALVAPHQALDLLRALLLQPDARHAHSGLSAPRRALDAQRRAVVQLAAALDGLASSAGPRDALDVRRGLLLLHLLRHGP